MDPTQSLPEAPAYFYLIATALPMLIVAGLRQLNLELGKHEAFAWLNPYLAGVVSVVLQILVGLQANVDLGPIGVAITAAAVVGLREWIDSLGKIGKKPGAAAVLFLLAAGATAWLAVEVSAATAERWFKTKALVTGALVETPAGLELFIEDRRIICPAELEFICRPLRGGDVVDVFGPDTPIDSDDQAWREMDRLCISRADQALPPPGPERRGHRR